MRRRVVASALLVSILLCLSACAQKLNIPTEPLASNTTVEGTQATEMGEMIHTPVPVEIPKSYPIPEENRQASILYSHGAASTQGDGYYGKAGTALTYFDAASGEKMFLCDQPGCRHSDETCKAYLGGYPVSMLEYRGMIYAAVQETMGSEGDAKIIQKDPGTGALYVIASWQATETEAYSAHVCMASDGLLAYGYTKHIFSDGQENWEEAVFFYDIETKESIPSQVQGYICAFSRDYVLTIYKDPEKEAAYLESEASDLTYEEVCARTGCELRRYDPEGQYKVIASSAQDGYLPFWDDRNVYGELYLFQLKDQIFLYDGAQDQRTLFLTPPEHLVQAWLCDRKVFILTNASQEEEIKIYYSDIDSPEWIPVDNRGEDSMLFSIYGEIDSMFYGLYHGCNSLIPKKDFYAANYEAARAGGV